MRIIWQHPNESVICNTAIFSQHAWVKEKPPLTYGIIIVIEGKLWFREQSLFPQDPLVTQPDTHTRASHKIKQATPHGFCQKRVDLQCVPSLLLSAQKCKQYMLRHTIYFIKWYSSCTIFLLELLSHFLNAVMKSVFGSLLPWWDSYLLPFQQFQHLCGSEEL